MTGTRQRKGITDIRTPSSGHIHGTPPREDSAYLRAYLLSKERERLEAEGAVLTKRVRQIQQRVEEIRAATEKLTGKAPTKPVSSAAAQAAPEAQTVEDKPSESGNWPTMTLDY